MKLPSFLKHDPNKQRPYWHVDAKWVCGLLLIVALAFTLPVAAAHRLTAKEPATKVVAYAMAGLTSTNGLDSAEGLEDIKARVAEKGSETITLGGIDVTFTAEDVNTLSPRELRLKVFTTFAESFYEEGARGLAESQGLDEATIEKAENDAFLIKNFSAEAHSAIGKVLRWMIVVDVLLLAALVFFSWRFGRLVSPGLVLVLVGLPGLLFTLIARQHPEAGDLARGDATNYAEMAGSFVSYLGPLIVPHVAGTYLPVFLTGVGLLLAAGVGKIAYAIVKHRKNDGPKEKPARETPPKTLKDD